MLAERLSWLRHGCCYLVNFVQQLVVELTRRNAGQKADLGMYVAIG